MYRSTRMWSSAHVRRWFWNFNSTAYSTLMPTFHQRWACLVLRHITMCVKRSTIAPLWKRMLFTMICHNPKAVSVSSICELQISIYAAISMSLLSKSIYFGQQINLFWLANQFDLLKKRISTRQKDGIAGQSMQRQPLYHTTYMNDIRTVWRNKAWDMHYCFKPFLSCFKWMVT